MEGELCQLYIQRHTHPQLCVINTLSLTFLVSQDFFSLSLKGPSEVYSGRKGDHSQATRKIPLNNSYGFQEAFLIVICMVFAHSTLASSHQMAN